MTNLFLNVLNLSISAGYIVLLVLVLRLLLKRALKWITVVLWGIVALRLILPFSIESIFSLIPSAETVSPDIMLDRTPAIDSGIPIVNQVVNPIIGGSFAPDPLTSVNPLQLWIPAGALLWIVGMAVLLVYMLVSYLRVLRRVGTAVRMRDNLYQSEAVVSPFVLGLFRPRIYLPFGIDEKHLEYVLAHENAHIRRRDHLWKPLGFLLLTIHWFNPLMWLGYILLCRDIELACDEKVIRSLRHDARADYSEALLQLSVNRRMIAACPLAFGEVGVKTRVRSVLNYKRPAFWIILAALLICIAVAVCFLTNPLSPDAEGETTDVPSDAATEAPGPQENPDAAIAELMRFYPEYFGLDAANGLDVYVWQLAQNSYSFGLLPHQSDRDWICMPLLQLRSASAEDMRVILSTYSIPREQIYIIPWQNPISSYLGAHWIIGEGEDYETKRAAYIEMISAMLFDGEMPNLSSRPSVDTSAPTLVYAAPAFSFVTSDVPHAVVRGSELYDKDTGKKLGNLSEIRLADTDFVALMGINGEHYREQGIAIQNTNQKAYAVELVSSPNAIDLEYVLIQNDGSLLLVYCHKGEAMDDITPGLIRWIFRIEGAGWVFRFEAEN